MEKLFGVQPHTQIPLKKSAKHNFTDTGNGLEFIFEMAIYIIHQFPDWLSRCDANPHDGLVFRIEFLDDVTFTADTQAVSEIKPCCGVGSASDVVGLES